MVGFSDAMEAAILQHVFCGTLYTPTTKWIGLFTADPYDGVSAAAVEVPFSFSYARQQISTNMFTTYSVTSSTSLGSSYTIKNNTDVLFPVATSGAWGTISFIGIFEAANATATGTACTLICSSQVGTAKVIADGDQLKIASQSLTISLD